MNEELEVGRMLDEGCPNDQGADGLEASVEWARPGPWNPCVECGGSGVGYVWWSSGRRQFAPCERCLGEGEEPGVRA